MSKLEKKIIQWINNHMIYLAFLFIIFTAFWIRLVGCDYVGNDYHFSLYDIPGNCHSLLYRTFVWFLFSRTDFIVILLKIFSYAGDTAVMLLVMLLWRQTHSHFETMHAFFILTACLLSPVALIYSMGGMRPDSVCMSLLLLGILCFRKGWFFLAATLTAFSAFLYPVYWPVVIVLSIWTIFKQKKDSNLTPYMAAAFLFLLCLLALSIFIENRGLNNGYFWGKIFVINPFTGKTYATPCQWLIGMCEIYGYVFAIGSLLLAFWHRKIRITALALQLTVLLYMGWQQTSAFMVI